MNLKFYDYINDTNKTKFYNLRIKILSLEEKNVQ